MLDPYCYPNSRVLKNILHITDQDELYSEERNLTNLRNESLLHQPIDGKFDFQHLKEIHRYLFQDVYGWAGEVRTVNIAKGGLFCLAPMIESQAEAIFSELAHENYLQELGAGEITKRLAYYLGEINALHPFREGNGRAQREFIRELAYYNGYFLAFASVSKEEMIAASEQSLRGDYGLLETMIGKVLRPV